MKKPKMKIRKKKKVQKVMMKDTIKPNAYLIHYY